MEKPIVKKKTNGKRNRSAGHSFELRVRTLMVEAGFPHVVTTRSESRSRDDQGIDLINKDEGKNGRLPYNIQCKNTVCSVNYAKVLGGMPKDSGAVNVIFHKFTEAKGDAGFHPRGFYAILDMHDYLKMVKRINELENKKDDSTY